MGALANATALRKDQTFFDWLTTAAVYVSRIVIQEDKAVPNHSVRLMLANDVVSSPELITSQLLALIATDPTVAVIGSTPEQIGETVILQKVEDIWTIVAKMRFPQA